ncbi:MAG: TonB family protein [Verrucomicrobiales bacterium]|nr:TonB family protein [Verrucomicrobiales bacterium]
MAHIPAISFAAALILHGAVLFGVQLSPSAPPPPREEYVEVSIQAEPAPDPQPEPPPEPVPPPPADTPPEPPEPEPMEQPPPPPPVNTPIPEPLEEAPKAAPEVPHPIPKPAPKTKPEKAARPVPPARKPSKTAARTGTAPSARPATTGDYQSVGAVRYLRRGQAVYPPEAERQRQTGTVRLMLYISAAGTVDRVEVAASSGFPLLDAAAAAAERKSRFRPLTVNGTAVKSKALVPYTFRLH